MAQIKPVGNVSNAEISARGFPSPGPLPHAVVKLFPGDKAKELLVSSLTALLSSDNQDKIRLYTSRLTIPPDCLVFSITAWPRPNQLYIISRGLFSKLKDDWSSRVQLAGDSVLEGKSVTPQYLERICWQLENFATAAGSSAPPNEFFVAVVDIKRGSRQVYLSSLDSKGSVVCRPLENTPNLIL